MTATKAAQDIGEVKGQLDFISKKLDSIDKKLIGNGQRGLLERAADLEGRVERVEKDVCDQDDILKLIDEHLKEISTHLSDKTIHGGGFDLKKYITVKNISLFVIIVAAINLIVPEGTVLWSMISKWLGI